MADIVDSSLTDNYSWAYAIRNYHPSSTTSSSGIGQSFIPLKNYKLTRADFKLYKTKSPTTSLYAELYLANINHFPTGSALATSNAFASSSLTATPTLIEFDFPIPYQMTSGIEYVIICRSGTDGTIDNTNMVGSDIALDTNPHSGYMCYYVSSAWARLAGSDDDICFVVYGTLSKGGASIIHLMEEMAFG